MIREHFTFRETIITILADSADDASVAKKAILAVRSELEEYIRFDPYFKLTYEPLAVPKCVPSIIQRMSDAGEEAGVGPMAAVAASIAWAGIEAMKENGAEFGLIDNGGDIVFLSDRDVSVGIYAGNAASSGKFAFVIPPQPDILGICTSSATVGPSVSFGKADAVVCFSKTPSNADAWATSLCNQISEDNFAEIMPEKSSLIGVYAVIGDWIGTWGSLPPVVPANVDTDLITRG
ncbi:MAG TPA: UPF0280 family protein [Methanocorpusculum sp.]|nr:UPF0280 family protein [Methanocorpusculum sp.]